MKKVILIIGISLACLIIASCMGNNLKKTMDSWMGHSTQELVRSWGIPTRTFTMPDGTEVYEYVSERGSVIMPVGRGYVNTGPRTCIKTMYAKNGIIDYWRYEGHCN